MKLKNTSISVGSHCLFYIQTTFDLQDVRDIRVRDVRVRDVRDVKDLRDVNVLKKTKDLMLITSLNPTSLWCYSPDPNIQT